MKLGLLQCDHVPENLLHIGGDYNDMFAAWLTGDWRVYDMQKGEAPANLDECDAYFSTGSRASVYEDEPWIHHFADTVRTLHANRKPFVGVCFGHQMLGHALGGVVKKSPRGWGVGVHNFQTVHAAPWMQPPSDSINVLMSCQDQVELLPPGAELLLASDFCPHAAFRIGNCLGIQGHPEFQLQYAREILEMRVKRIGTDAAERARLSFVTPPDSALLASWIHHFLQLRAETKY